MAELSEERLAPSNGIEIAYQEVGDPDGEPLILVMGLATQMIAWDEEFCAHAGGTWLPRRPLRQPRHRPLDHARRRARAQSRWTSSCADARRAAYLLSDMAADTVGLMDHLGIESAHVAGDLDGRDDRPDDGDRAPGPDPLAGLDALDHRQPPGRARRR